VPLLLAASPAVALATAAPAPIVVGKVAYLIPTLSGTMPNGPTMALAKLDDVRPDMTLATAARASAQIVFVGGVKGTLIMGADSKVVFDQWVVWQGTRSEIGFQTLVGKFLVFFLPQTQGHAAGKVTIKTPAGTLELHGTAVCVEVAPNGTTTIAVLEGLVTLKGAVGGEVQLPQGAWTRVVPGEPPAVQSHGAPAFDLPAHLLVEDPPHLDLRRLVLDLPKAGRR
jgi:hypothetical protein